ncbi:MAG: histidine phosphatase family protein [Chloroflexota bacterium]
MSRLLLARHGETELNSSFRYWGSTDAALSELGLSQAECLRERLSREKIDFIYSSFMRRALVTAQIIASEHSLEIVACPELREIDFGRAEGLTFDEISRSFPEVARMSLERDPALAYPGGESLADMDKRVSQFRTRLEKHNTETTGLIVAHSGVLRTLICQLLGIEPEQRWQIRLDLASLSIIETNHQGTMLNLLNDVSHLTKRS